MEERQKTRSSRFWEPLAICAAIVLPFAPSSAQDCVCRAPSGESKVRVACEGNGGCWVFTVRGEDPQQGEAQGGCFPSQGKEPTGREALISEVSGKFEQVPVSEIVQSLTRRFRLDVKVLGDGGKRLTVSFKGRPLQLVLADIERLAQVRIETVWLPRIPSGERFSFGAEGTARNIAALLAVAGGRSVALPQGKEDARVRLSLESVTTDQAIQELNRALP